MRIMLLLVASLLAACLAPAGSAGADSPIQATRAWARASPSGGGPVAVYLTLRDRGRADRLTSVTADAAGMVMIHQSTQQNGVSEMRELQSVGLPARGTVVFRPGALHVMLMDLNRTLRPGDTFSLVLTFDHAPPVTVKVPVLPPGSPGPGPAAP